jgi:hypothetical protein
MKKIKNEYRPNFLKRLFIKLCRVLGYEIIDQNNFIIPTSKKEVNDTLSIQGLKSINLPLGEVKITRSVSELIIIIRSCTSINMLTQSKKRIFEKDKYEYTLRSINSILKSTNQAKKIFKKINFKIIVVDHNSSQKNLDSIKELLNKSGINNEILNLDINEFKENIKKINEENKIVIDNQISNMSNIRKSLDVSKKFKDLVYFVEDDYVHKLEAISEMIYAYERIASQINSELILCPTDYPFLYTKAETTEVYLGEKYHWRKINETLCTFLTSKTIINNYWDDLIGMCEFEHYPFESPLHKIYKKELCISPIPSLAIHCTNINSIYGLSPNINWKKLWEDNKV